jgi:hypothetical protein
MSRADVEHLYRAVLPAIRHALEEHGEFRAFGAALGTDGKVMRIEPKPGGHDGGPSGYVLAVHAAVQSVAAANDIVAACVCTEVTLEADDLGETPDGIRIHLEDGHDEVIDVLVPYRPDGEGGIEYGELVAQEAERRLLARRVD